MIFTKVGRFVIMKKINIYITQTFKGNLAAGNGKFYIVLELINKDGSTNPNTRQHMKGYTNTTKNRLALLACIEALSHVTEVCDITLHIDSHYIAGNEGRLVKWTEAGWISGGNQIKNQDLWRKYQEAAACHILSVCAEKKHCYQIASYIQLKKDIPMNIDRRGSTYEE